MPNPPLSGHSPNRRNPGRARRRVARLRRFAGRANTYNGNVRVSKQTLADGGLYRFAYTPSLGGKITQTEVTDPLGTVRRVTFNAGGYPCHFKLPDLGSLVALLGDDLQQFVAVVLQLGRAQS